ncbi:hypothetical protein KRR40_08920 [Niabella defluvii]|nr:hypothetical protein KRR40_08920 [Niabella sp. I65]
MIKDNKNRLVGRFENGEFDTTAVAGRGLKTFLDADLQDLAEKLFADKLGGVVAIDPKTGGILAMASGPTFNPNDLTGPNFKRTMPHCKCWLPDRCSTVPSKVNTLRVLPLSPLAVL